MINFAHKISHLWFVSSLPAIWVPEKRRWVKHLLRQMDIPFVDLDWYIEERFHKTVGELFTERGETGFRELERNMLHEVAEFENVVISTGGGAPCFFDNMDFMNRTGKTVFLDVHPDVLFRRLRVAKQ